MSPLRPQAAAHQELRTRILESTVEQGLPWPVLWSAALAEPKVINLPVPRRTWSASPSARLIGMHFHLLIGSNTVSVIKPMQWVIAFVVAVPSRQGQSVLWDGLCHDFLPLAGTSSLPTQHHFTSTEQPGSPGQYGLAMPFYWVLHSIGAWKGFLQLITRPHHWEKTTHFSEPADAAPGAAAHTT